MLLHTKREGKNVGLKNMKHTQQLKVVHNFTGGRKRLPKFKFSAKFPIGLHVILQIQIKKN